MRTIKFRAWQEHSKSMRYPIEERIGQSSGDILNSCLSTHIMQFTGLTDRHGREIYEDDICQTFGGFKVVVKFGIGIGSHPSRISIGFHLENDNRHYEFPSEHGGIEVLGNLHEHPELLK